MLLALKRSNNQRGFAASSSISRFAIECGRLGSAQHLNERPELIYEIGASSERVKSVAADSNVKADAPSVRREPAQSRRPAARAPS